MARFGTTSPRRLVIGVLVVVVVAALGYLAVTAFLARRDLNDAKAALSIVKARLLAGDRIGANAELATAERSAAG